jgi:hypothetical protein
MAAIYGANYTKEYINVPSEQGLAGEMGGRVKCMFDIASTGAGSDVLNFGKIPAGARILRCSSIGGNSPTFNVAPGEKLTVETVVEATLGAAPTFPVSVFVEYLLD